MSEEENERDFMKACFNAVAGLEVKNESQAIAKEVILNEVENLTKENNQLKEVIEEVREIIKTAVPKNNGDYMMLHFDNWSKLEETLDKAKENK